MKRFPLLTMVGFALLLALLAFSFSQPGTVAAFDHTWFVFAANNVVPGEVGLWDDVASGGGPLNEAGLFWIMNNEALDETVIYKTTEVQLSSSVYRILTARAALNDAGVFRVGYVLNNPDAPCVFPAALAWPPAQADDVYRVKSFTLPAGGTVRAICMSLTDNPDAVAIGRSNALIDYIRLRNLAGVVGWKENFTGAP